MLRFSQFGRKYKQRHPRATHDLMRRKYQSARKLYFGADDDESEEEWPQFSLLSPIPVAGEEPRQSLRPTLYRAFRNYVLYALNAYAEYATKDPNVFESTAEDDPPVATYASELATRELELYYRRIDKEDRPRIRAPLNMSATDSPKLQKNRGVFMWFSTYDNMDIKERKKFFNSRAGGQGIKNVASFEDRHPVVYEPSKDEQTATDVTKFTPIDWKKEKPTSQTRVYLECMYLNGPDKYTWGRLDSLVAFIRKASETSVVCAIEVGLYAFSINIAAHANIVIVNGPARRLEYFEPHGATNDMNQIDVISKTAVNFFKDLAELTGYTFVTPAEVCPVPIQTVEEGDKFDPHRDIENVLEELNISAKPRKTIKEIKTMAKLNRTFQKFPQLRGSYCSFWTRMAVDLHTILAERGIDASLREILDEFMKMFPSNEERFFITVCYTIFVTDPNRIDHRIPSLYGGRSIHLRSASLFKQVARSLKTTDYWVRDPMDNAAFVYVKSASKAKIKARFKTQKEIRQGGDEVKDFYKSVELAFKRTESEGESGEVIVTVNFDRNGVSVRKKDDSNITVMLVEPLWHAKRDVQELLDKNLLPNELFTNPKFPKIDRNRMRLFAYHPNGKKRVVVS